MATKLPKPLKILPSVHTTNLKYQQLTPQDKGLEIQRMHYRNFIRSRTVLFKILLFLNFLGVFAYILSYKWTEESYYK